MDPRVTRGETSQFMPPEGWKKEDGPCGNLSVRVEKHGARAYHHSTWKPTPDELITLANGGVIELCCVGVQPPVALSVLAPLAVVK